MHLVGIFSVVVVVHLKFLLLYYYSTTHIKPLSQSIQQPILRKPNCSLFVHRFPLSLLRLVSLLWSMPSFMPSASSNGSSLSLPICDLQALGLRAAHDNTVRVAPPPPLPWRLPHAYDLKKTYVNLQQAPSLCARLAWASGR